ncbi:hypothetical protein [Sphingobacterium pedocola]|uniref:DUF3649 domain-containing protein n=1 Tax=Sphingobacterium pedocola TaxID=2082722 RepID=A0ABR9TC88_9SPHI|nr:hypothetical protein [Sphingobacterium pedocola]MBE8722674.1 hypothetical protein [Sphingobacterium pedocola]
MPANTKYLSSPGQRILKVSAAILGGYLLSGAIHLAAARIPYFGMNLLITGTLTMFLLWAVFMIISFLSKNGWKIWGIYIGFTLLFGLIAFYGGGPL